MEKIEENLNLEMQWQIEKREVCATLAITSVRCAFLVVNVFFVTELKLEIGKLGYNY